MGCSLTTVSLRSLLTTIDPSWHRQQKLITTNLYFKNLSMVVLFLNNFGQVEGRPDGSGQSQAEEFIRISKH